MIPVSLTIRRLRNELPRFGYAFAREGQLQEAIGAVLAEAGIPFEREFVASEKSRLDFFIDGAVAVEVKVDGSAAAALQQAARYCTIDQVQAVVLVATPAWARALVPEFVSSGKAIHIIALRRQAF